jgi:phosphoglycolate phosphatase
MNPTTRPLAPLLIFDLDGTLYRTESSFVPTMRTVYARHGRPYPGDAAVLARVGETFEAFVAWVLGHGFDGDAASLQREIADLELATIAAHGVLYDGVPETLDALADRGCPLALCTNGDRPYVDAVLARGRLAGRFARLRPLDEGGASKAVRVGELLREFAPRPAIVVGDRWHDVEAARANGCRVVGALYGYARDGELASADASIGSIRELPSVVDRWG